MPSVASALTWSLLWRSPWTLLGAALGANLLPVLLLSALSSAAAIDPRDPALIVIHVVLSQMNMFVFAAALFTAQGPVNSLFAFPLPTTTIVFWRLAPAMALMFLESALSGGAINLLYGLDWPVIGPAVFVAVAFAAVQSTFWLAGETWRLPFAVGAVAALVGGWHKSRYGDAFSMPTRLWEVVTPLDAGVMLGIFLLSLAAGVIGVARSRRGDQPSALGVPEWLEELVPLRGEPTAKFSSPEAAQAWLEWRRKGWVLPVTVLFGMFLGITAWGIGSRQTDELLEGFIAGGALLSMMALLGGLAFGNTGRNDSDLEMRQFQGTRPMTNRRMARVTLTSLAGSIALAWGIWLAGLVVAYIVARATGGLRNRPLLQEAWWFVPMSFLGAWTVGGLSTSLGLIGDARLMMRTLAIAFSAVIGGAAITNFGLSPEAKELVWSVAAVLCGIAFVAGTIWAFAVARRSQLIEPPDILLSLGVWLLLTTFLILLSIDREVGVARVLLGCGLLALVVAPLPAAPLALARNRTR